MPIALSLSLLIWLAPPAQKPNDWAMQNAMIGSPIEIEAGTTYQARVTYPVPDGPSYPLKAHVEWSIQSPVTGLSIDKTTGKITADATVAHGTQATIQANVNNGQKLLKAKLYVFSRSVNPFIGQWKLQSVLGCAAGKDPDRNAAQKIIFRGSDLHFDVPGAFFMGRAHGIAAGILMSGKYDFDLKSGKLTLRPDWPRGKVPLLMAFTLDAGKKLTLVSSQAIDATGSICGYRFQARD